MGDRLDNGGYGPVRMPMVVRSMNFPEHCEQLIWTYFRSHFMMTEMAGT